MSKNTKHNILMKFSTKCDWLWFITIIQGNITQLLFLFTRDMFHIIVKSVPTFSNEIPSVLDASSTSCSSERANSIALKATSVVTAVILRIPLAIPSSDKRANALASRVFDIWVPEYVHKINIDTKWWKGSRRNIDLQEIFNLHKVLQKLITIFHFLDQPRDPPLFDQLTQP